MKLVCDFMMRLDTSDMPALSPVTFLVQVSHTDSEMYLGDAHRSPPLQVSWNFSRRCQTSFPYSDCTLHTQVDPGYNMGTDLLVLTWR